MAPHLRQIGRNSALGGHRSHLRRHLLWAVGRCHRTAQGLHGHGHQLLGRHRYSGAHTPGRVALPGVLSLSRGLRRRRSLLRRSAAGAGIRSRLEARKNQRPGYGGNSDRPAARFGAGRVPGSRTRLARPVCHRPDPRPADAAHPHVGSRIAALAGRSGPAGGSAQILGMGLGSASRVPALADARYRDFQQAGLPRALPSSPQPAGFLGHQHRRADRLLRLYSLGSHAARAWYSECLPSAPRSS